MRTSFWGVSLLILSAVGLLKAAEFQPENHVRFSSDTSWNFNPFSLSSWMSIPSQAMKFWFPLFQPPYRPPNVTPKTTTTTTTTTTTKAPPQQEQEQHRHEDTNIFGMVDTPDDNVGYLPEPNEIEWD